MQMGALGEANPEYIEEVRVPLYLGEVTSDMQMGALGEANPEYIEEVRVVSTPVLG